MIWSIALVLVGAGIWWRADPESARALVAHAFKALREAARWVVEGDAMPRRLLGLLALIFVLRWLAVFAQYGVTDGLRVMTGEGREGDEDVCHSHQRTVHAKLLRDQKSGRNIGHRGGMIGAGTRCHSTHRTLTFDIWGRLTCRAHGPADNLPAVLK